MVHPCFSRPYHLGLWFLLIVADSSFLDTWRSNEVTAFVASTSTRRAASGVFNLSASDYAQLHRRSCLSKYAAARVQSCMVVEEGATPGDGSYEQPTKNNNGSPNMEAAWRHIKKPLLRIGANGVAPSHGNSLRDLLAQHEVVKVKINKNNMGTLEEAFDVLRNVAQQSGAPEGIELLRVRPSDRMVMCGLPGMSERIGRGEFPPAPKPPRTQNEDGSWS